MEESAPSLLQNQDSSEGPKVDPLDLMKAYKDKLLEEMWKQQDSLEAPAPSQTSPQAPDEDSDEGASVLRRLRALEAENSALSLENRNQRKQYERCLDEVANQVVQALLAQKDLKEECVKLRTRVFDLEQQNRLLSVFFQQRVGTAPSPPPPPLPQEIQRNGKVSIGVGRWPGLLSLTCPRGSRGGGRLPSSGAGSRTWAEGRGPSKQQRVAGWDPETSAGPLGARPADLQRLQSSVSKENRTTASDEGISLPGVKMNPSGTNKNVVGGISHESGNHWRISQESGGHMSGEVQSHHGAEEPLTATTDNAIFSAEAPENLKEHPRAESHNSGVTLSDSNNNPEPSGDRKSRLDRPDSRARDADPGARHSAAKALSCVSEARQRSSSAEVPRHGDGVSRNPKPKAQLCDSARKAFILRSKSADAGAEQHKQVRSPLHQNLIPGHKSGCPNKRANHGKAHSLNHEAEKDDDSKSLERVQQRSPLASPVKSASLTADGEDSKAPAAQPQAATVHPERLADPSASSEPGSPPALLPPGRTASLLLRTASDSGQVNDPPCAGKSASVRQSDFSVDNQVVLNGHSPRPPPAAPHLESEPGVGRAAAYHGGTVAPKPNVLQRSQQSISEPKLSQVPPQTYADVYYAKCQSAASRAAKTSLPANARSHEAISGAESATFFTFARPQNREDPEPWAKGVQSYQTYICEAHVMKERKTEETRCSSLDSEPGGGGGVTPDWGLDEEGWLFKRSVSVSTRPPLKPVMGMNGAKARSQSFGARYAERPGFNRSGKVRTQIKTHSGSSLNSLGDVLPGSVSCSASYHCPLNRSLLNNFLMEEGPALPPWPGSSGERLQRRLQIEQQFRSAFGEPVCEEAERRSAVTAIEEKVMLGIEENLHKSQEQERSSQVKHKSGSALANWFGFRKGKLPAKTDVAKAKEEKRDPKISSLLGGGKQTKTDKKRERRKSDGKDCSAGRRESHDAVRACIAVPCPRGDIIGDAQRGEGEKAALMASALQDAVTGEMEAKRLTYMKSKSRAAQQKEQSRLQLAN
ncbi:nck-associated protein 5-like isoform X3 [Syngnathus scovelli]|uniref:nck-associated protein 5-like isoform X3 n=1 Tax=Syngnathus scovelli TaxID=161590 RepID=UPI002110AF05|nr:nck-associated protein 5 isoform X3 [Syngnathus scovelli]